MAIIQSELVWREADVMVSGASNGGRMTGTAISDAVKNNIFPDVPQAERTAGSTVYRKVYIHVANDSDLDLIQPRIFVETPSPGDDSVMLLATGDQIDTESGITGSERNYGAGFLNANVSGGASTFDVATEGVALAHFLNGDTIRISDKTDVDDVVGNEEYHTINAVVTYSADVATIQIAGTLANAYTTASNTRVAAVIEPADISGAVTVSVVVTSAAGTYDDTTFPVLVDHIAGVHEAWTLTFTDGSNFDLTGDTLTGLGSHTTGSDLQPTNATFAKPYFIMDQLGFGGTFLNLDTITFTTSPAATPVWYKRVIPAGAASLSANKVIVAVDGQSA